MENEMEIVEKARKQFDKDFFTEGYNDIISDSEHLNKILEDMILKSGNKVLDLGTGSGYVAFALAEKFKVCNIIGLDIVNNTIKRNNEIVKEEQISNIKFIAYDGITIPFEKDSFDSVVTRYALHHFPNIENTIKELESIVKCNGQVFVSDPTPNDIDDKGFIDDYMKQRDDGHIKFYTKSQYETMFNRYGFELDKFFLSKIRFPRVMEEKYNKLLQKYDKTIINSYNIEIEDNKIFITENVLNMSFKKVR
ncbi:MAG TPA: class I SAM-dependent methyltransferase [Clostridium sp.]